MDNAGGPSRSDQLDLMLTYEQQAHARTKAERDSLRNKLTAMTAARHIEEDRANEADGQLAVLNAEMVALHTQLGAEDEETVLDAVLRLQRSHEDDTVLLGTVAAERDAALQRAEQLQREHDVAICAAVDLKQRAEQAEADVRLLLAESRGVSHALMVQPSEPMPLSDEAIAYSRGYSAAKAHIDIIVREIEGRFGRLDLRCQQAEAALAQVQAEREWKPIETAPRDGREVILAVALRAGIPHGVLVGHCMPGGHCIEDHPAIDGGWYFWNGCMFDKAANPTHWMEMPCHPLASAWQKARQQRDAQPPALPPLPEGWVEKHVKGKRTEAEVRFTYLDEGGCDVQIYAMADAVRFWQVGTVPSVADLITVLRHAERAHKELQEGSRG